MNSLVSVENALICLRKQIYSKKKRRQKNSGVGGFWELGG